MCSEKLESLEVLLGQYTEKALFELARNYKIRGYSLVDKAELIKKLSHAILEEAQLIMAILVRDDLEILEQLIQDKAIEITESNQELAEFFVSLGWARFNRQVIYVSKEIGLLCEQQKSNEAFIVKHQQMQQLRRYRNGLLNLYGLVEVTWLKQLYQRDVDLQIDMREFLKAIEIMNSIYKGCRLISYYIVHESLYCVEKEDFKHFKELIGNYEYYEPSAHEIIDLENEFYYVETLETRRVKEYLKKNCLLEEEVAEFAVAILSVHMRIQEDVKMVNMLQVLEEWYRLGIHIGSTKQLEGMIPLVLQMMERTRMWRLKGQMPIELGIKLMPVVSKTGRATQEKVQVGRNELCPCGSGKKYKKCCLNKNE